MLNGHTAGNGRYSQAGSYAPPRRGSTQLIRTHGLNGGLTDIQPMAEDK
jgi:hypothetical protein